MTCRLCIAFILICIPVITIGPACTHCIMSLLRLYEEKEDMYFREFLKSFRLNFKRAILSVLMTILFVILGFDLAYAYGLTAPDSTKGSLLMGVFIGITFLVLASSIYIFPILSRFDMTVKQLIKAAIFMSMRHIHFTLLMMIVYVLAAFAIVYRNSSQVYSSGNHCISEFLYAGAYIQEVYACIRRTTGGNRKGRVVFRIEAGRKDYVRKIN